MSGLVRAKRVNAPLDDQAKARIVGVHFSYVSSGSEHSTADSPCLSELVHGFLEDDFETQSFGYDSDSDIIDSLSDPVEFAEDVLRSCTSSNGDYNLDSYRNLLFAHVLKAMELFACLHNQKPVLRRKVMSFLSELGHNAAICKTKWESSGGLSAGNYEFIDVLQSQNRYIVDLDFASQFEIARPTTHYLTHLQSLPKIFVGKSEDLKRIIKTISDAAKRSLKSRELSLPPWRKHRYMQNKWFGPYRRTTNPISASSSTPVIQPVSGVACRLVGFDDAVSGRLFVPTR